jgi:hypothetical protein
LTGTGAYLVIVASFLMLLLGANSFSQKQQNDIIHNRSNPELNKEHTTVGQSLLQQEPSATSEVRIEMVDGTRNSMLVIKS